MKSEYVKTDSWLVTAPGCQSERLICGGIGTPPPEGTPLYRPGIPVRFNIPDGAHCIVMQHLRDGFYLLRVIPEHREMVAHESDLILDDGFWKDEDKLPNFTL